MEYCASMTNHTARSAPRTRIEEHLNNRRLDLGLRWREVALLADISPTTMGKIRVQGTQGVDPVNVRAIENALRLEHGSIRAVEEGGELKPIPDAAPDLRLVDAPGSGKAWQLTRRVLGQEATVMISATPGMTEDWARQELERIADRLELEMRRGWK